MTEQTQEPGLSLQDIVAAVQIIDAAVQRGAIRGEEMVAVGTVRDRFAAFAKHAQTQDGGVPEAEEIPVEEAAE